jgi:PE family
MSFVFAVPDVVATAATDLAGIGSSLGQANSAAAAQTTQMLAAGEDEVSAAVAAFFGAHALDYQAASAQAATFHAPKRPTPPPRPTRGRSCSKTS